MTSPASPLPASPVDARAALRRLLARTLEAAGGAAAWSPGLVTTTGTITAGGLSGPYEQRVDPDDGRFVTSYALGPARIERGFDGDRAWVRQPSGEVVVQDADAARRLARAEAWVHASGWWRGAHRPAVLEGPSFSDDGGQRIAWLHATPDDALPVDLGFDDATGLLARVAMEVNGTRTTRRLEAPARADDGVPRARRVATGSGDPRREVVVQVERIARESAGPLDAGEPLAAGGARSFSPPLAAIDDTRFADGATTCRLPATIANGHVFVTASVDGHALRFLLDTGAVNVLVPGAAARAGLRVEGALEVRGPGARDVSAGFARAGRLAFGDTLAIERPLFRVLPLDELAAVEGVPIDGLLGLELFQRLVVAIDAANGHVDLCDPTRFVPDAGATTLPLAFHAHVPAVRASLDGAAGEFWLDTGNRNAVTLWAPFAEAQGFAARAAQAHARGTVIGWGLGGRVTGRAIRARVLHLGEFALDAPVVTLPDARAGVTATRDVAGNLGAEVMRRFALAFDYGRRVVHLVANDALAAPFEADGAGAWLNESPARDTLVVAALQAGGPAAEAGLREGDELVAIDDVAVAALGLDAVRGRLRDGHAGETRRLVLRRDRQRVGIVLTLRRLVA